jgi:hypothetical protein
MPPNDTGADDRPGEGLVRMRRSTSVASEWSVESANALVTEVAAESERQCSERPEHKNEATPGVWRLASRIERNSSRSEDRRVQRFLCKHAGHDVRRYLLRLYLTSTAVTLLEPWPLWAVVDGAGSMGTD